jgi:aldehyde dehydrogenase (NAD+)
MRIAQAEIFGPVLCIQPYRDVDDAIRLANLSNYGLGGYVQGRDMALAREVAARMRTGTVNINAAPIDPAAPFGGYKHSGNGRERGHFGIDDYLEIKSIVGFADARAGHGG